MRLFMFMEAFEIDAYEWLFLKSYCERGIYLMEDLVWQVKIFEYFHFLIFFFYLSYLTSLTDIKNLVALISIETSMSSNPLNNVAYLL